MKSFYRFFVILAALSCCLNLASAQDETEWMPDDNLRNIVREALNLDSSTTLTQQAMQSLTSLRAENSNITNIKGLEYATQLETLNLSANEISNIALLEDLTRLTELTLNSNRIQVITPLEALINLRRLDLSFNRISDIAALTELTRITNLDLPDNQISDITALTALTRITRLDLSGNQIENVTPLTDLTRITSLSLSDNQISNIATLRNLTGTTKLDIFGNQLEDVTPLTDLTRITSLNLSDNQISDITALRNLDRITRLELAGNQIQDVTSLTDLIQITNLNLSGNQISDIATLEDLIHLRRLYLNTNQITDAAPLEVLENLEVLWISGNPISDLSPLRTLLEQNPDVKMDIQLYQLVAATGTTLAVEKPSGLNRSSFAIRPGEFVLLVHTDQQDVSARGDFRTYRSYYSLDANTASADFPNLAAFFRNGGRIELITDINQNPLSTGTHAPEFGDLVITEIMWGLDGTSENKQWIELYNASRKTYTFAEGSLNLRFSDTSTHPLSDNALTPAYNANTQVKVIDRVSNINNTKNRKSWNVPGRSGNTSQNRPLISMHRVINYTTGKAHNGTQASSWKASSGRVNFSPPNHGTPGAEHLSPSPTVLIDVVERPPMFWIEANASTLHGLTGNTVAHLFPSVQNATGFTVDTANGKLYWIEKGNNTGGTIRRANMNGSDLEIVKRLTSVPRGIAIDPINGKIYVTNARNKIYRLNLDGSDYQSNFITGLASPENITIDTENSKIYWSEGASLKRANLNGLNRKQIVKGSDPLTGIAIAGGKIYWTEMSTGKTNSGEIRCANLNGANIKELVTINGSVPLGIAVDFPGRKLYWTNSHGKIRRADLNGSNPEDVVIGLQTPGSFSVGSSLQPVYTLTGPVIQSPAIYWADKQAAKIQRVNLNTANVEGIVSGVPDSSAIALDLTKGQIYWTETDTGKIRRANLNGSNVQDLISGLGGPLSIALDLVSGKIYWTDQNWNPFTGAVTASKIRRANLNGSNVQDLISGLGTAEGIALDTSMGKVYWTDSEMGKIQRANLNGSNVQDLVNGAGTPSDIALDTAGGKMYWADYEGKQISRANLNGSNVETLVTGLAGPSDIVLDTARRKMYWADQEWNPAAGSITDSKIQRANLDGSNVQEVLTNFGEPVDIALGAVQTSSTGISGNRSASDVNADGKVNNTDLTLVALALGQKAPANSRVDVNGDGIVNAADLIVVISNLDDAVVPAAPEIGTKLTAVDRTLIQAEINNLQLANDGSLQYQRALVFLQSLLASSVPQKTRLLANYPNPFNPETWIPYQLASGTDVQICIYDAKGTLIRQLELGYQPGGYYTERNRAAYWDGRNALGERVASGLYFYQLRTNESSALRKMLILK